MQKLELLVDLLIKNHQKFLSVLPSIS